VKGLSDGPLDDTRENTINIGMLVGEAYPNFGLIGVFVLSTAFGTFLKSPYKRRQQAYEYVIICGIFVYSIRIFFESVEKYGRM
jgi:hypothetical membrane protein